jgi:hypothetical protein
MAVPFRGSKRSSAYDFLESTVCHALEVDDWIFRIRETGHEFCHPWICDDFLVCRVTPDGSTARENDRLVIVAFVMSAKSEYIRFSGRADTFPVFQSRISIQILHAASQSPGIPARVVLGPEGRIRQCIVSYRCHGFSLCSRTPSSAAWAAGLP